MTTPTFSIQTISTTAHHTPPLTVAAIGNRKM